jgi:hypothetical protein
MFFTQGFNQETDIKFFTDVGTVYPKLLKFVLDKKLITKTELKELKADLKLVLKKGDIQRMLRQFDVHSKAINSKHHFPTFDVDENRWEITKLGTDSISVQATKDGTVHKGTVKVFKKHIKLLQVGYFLEYSQFRYHPRVGYPLLRISRKENDQYVTVYAIDPNK